jgi:hypothetical protein
MYPSMLAMPLLLLSSLLRAASAAQRLVRRGILLSAGDCKVLARNETGVSINSGWTVKGRPTTYVSQ